MIVKKTKENPPCPPSIDSNLWALTPLPEVVVAVLVLAPVCAIGCRYGCREIFPPGSIWKPLETPLGETGCRKGKRKPPDIVRRMVSRLF